MDRKKSVAFAVSIFTLLIILSGCANQLPPGGGELDKTPPEIVEAYPPSGTTNFKDDYFYFDFSEYVDKRSFRDAIFISPAIEGQMEFSWTGKSVEIYFPEKFKDSITYVVTIGTDVEDLNNRNKMAQSYNLIFSTGDKIDTRVISGKVFNTKPEGIMIYAYKLKDAQENVFKRKPDYISQTGSDGTYSLKGLAKGFYRISAVQDALKDFEFQPEQDKIGIPPFDVELTDTDTLRAGLNFFVSTVDTVKPRLLSATMTDKNHILISVSEEFDSTIITSLNFAIVDSTSDSVYLPRHAYKGNTKSTEMVLTTSDDLKEENNIYLFVNRLTDKNKNETLNDYSKITVSTKPDTLPSKLFKADPPAFNSISDIDNQQFVFSFDDAFDSNLVKQAIELTDSMKNLYSYAIKFLDDATFSITSKKSLSPKKNYQLKINLKNLRDPAGNFRDSIYTYNFRTISGFDFTGLSGSLKNAVLSLNPVLVIASTTNPKAIYRTKPDSLFNFSFERVEAGNYNLICFYDEDKNERYSYGWPYPFGFSERFYFYPDPIDLKPRWTLTDVVFELK
jgi:hypothetical protein